MEARQIPKFATEAEEAQWWYDNRDALAEDWSVAAQNGSLRKGIGLRHRSAENQATKQEEPVRKAS